VAVSIDGDRNKLRRREKYPLYKSDRGERPQEIRDQLPIIYEFLKLNGIKVFHHEKSESDDICASFARTFSEKKISNIIITSDGDLVSCFGNYTKIGLLRKDGVYVLHKVRDIKEKVKKCPVEPNQVIDFLALMGDKSDCVPGVSGIGIKTAKKLIDEYGNLDNIYNNLENIENKRISNLLLKGRNDAYISRYLVKLKNDLELINDISEVEFNFDYDKNFEFMQKYNFETYLYNKMADYEFDF